MKNCKDVLLSTLVITLLLSSTSFICHDIKAQNPLYSDSMNDDIIELEEETDHFHSLYFGESTSDEKCPNCGGTGQVITKFECENKTCLRCGGTGEISTYVWKEGSCLACRGSGKIITGITEKGVLEYGTCLLCKGTKVSTRPFLETIPCPNCHGTKVYTHCFPKYGPCPYCNENGENEETSSSGSGELVANIVELEGDVRIYSKGKFIVPKIGMLIFSRDVLITGSSSKAKLYYQDGSVILLDENTEVKVSIIEEHLKGDYYSENYVRFLESFLGRVLIKLKIIEKEEWRIRTRIGAAMSVRGTEFILDVANDGTTNITVFQGCVEVSDFEYLKTVLVGQNQTSTIEPGDVPSDPISIDPSEIDRWWEWEEDKVEEKGIPGFEAIAVIAAIAVALIILRRKK